MKLEELRALYAVPEVPKEPKLETAIGVDPACGPDKTAVVLRCDRCDLVMTITEHAKADILLAYCPSCDVGCAMCKRLRDDDGNKLRIRETGSEKRRVCDRCRFEYYDVLADRFTSDEISP
jgi:hypothetical protein